MNINKYKNKIFHPIGKFPNDWVVIVDSPHISEVKSGLPMSGLVGPLVHTLMKKNRLHRSNLITGFLIPHLISDEERNNAAIFSSHISKNMDNFWALVKKAGAKYLVLVGAATCRAVLGKIDLEMQHGIPFYWNNFVVLPIYHPLSGLDHNMLTHIEYDWEAFGNLYHKKLRPVEIEQVDYNNFYMNHQNIDDDSLQHFKEQLQGNHIGVDTETVDNKPWSVQISCGEDSGIFISVKETKVLKYLGEYLARPNVVTVLHNAEFDLDILEQVGIVPSKVLDVMRIAHNLGNEPQSLKRLVYRHLHKLRGTYQDVVATSTTKRALNYLNRILESTWPDPEPYCVWDIKPKYAKNKREVKVPCTVKKKGGIVCGCGGFNLCPDCNGKGFYYIKNVYGEKYLVPRTENGHWREVNPRNISSKITRLLNDYSKNPDCDLTKKWSVMQFKDEIIEAIGDMPYGSLDEIPLHHAVNYSVMDASDTLAVCKRLVRKAVEFWGKEELTKFINEYNLWECV